MKLLLVEDDDVDRLAVVRALRATPGLDAELVEVSDAPAALEACARERFDCLLLDYRLPKADGLELLRRLRAAGVKSPVIVLTGQGDEQLAVELMKAGASDYISKASLRPSRLWRSIAQAVELSRARHSFEQAEAERARAEVSLELLAAAGKSLSATLDLESTLTAVVDVFVPQWADVSALVLSDNGSLRLAACVTVDPQKDRLLREYVARFPLDPAAVAGSAAVARSGRSQVFPRLTQEDVLMLAQNRPDALEALRALGMTSLILAPVENHGRVIGILVLGSTEETRRYSSAQVLVAEEVGRRAAVAIENARLFEMAQRERRRAEEANRAKDEFLALVSHEVRTPLNAILGWANMLLGGSLDDAQSRRALVTIERNAKAQAQLIDDLLDVSRIITGKLRIEVGPVDLVRVVESAIDVVRPAADAKGVRLRSAVGREPAAMIGDANRLAQVAWNLLSNAVKFTPRGGEVVVELERLDASLILVVRDTGPGIDPAFLPHVFDRFRQADMATTRKISGLGLGLAIVKHIAELHGGSVEAESGGLGAGATFTVRLPVAPLRASSPAAAPLSERSLGPASVLSPPEIEGLKVLVVDDELDARELLISVFEYCKAIVTAASSAQEAMQLIESDPPEVIVSDVGMPGEDGYALIERIRALPRERGGRTPAVALTAYARNEDRTRALLAGFNMHVAKPIEPTELLVVVASVSGRRPDSRA